MCEEEEKEKKKMLIWLAALGSAVQAGSPMSQFRRIGVRIAIFCIMTSFEISSDRQEEWPLIFERVTILELISRCQVEKGARANAL